MEAIVIYYSWGGNTKSIAEKVARALIQSCRMRATTTLSSTGARTK